MDYQATETIILNDEEFVLLIAAAGISSWYGIDIGRKTDFVRDEGAVNRTMAELYRKGIIDWGEEKAAISEEMKSILNVLRRASVCITCTNEKMPQLVSGSYCSNGDVVMIERGVTGDSEIKLTMMQSDEWVSYFEQGSFFPNVIEPPQDISADDLFLEKDDMITEFEVREIPSGKLLEQVMLFDCGVYGMIIDNGINNSFRQLFSPEAIKSIMHSWAGGASK